MAVVSLVLLLGASPKPVLGQGETCGERPSLQVTILDESGSIALPGAMVVLYWSDAEESPLRERAGPDGRFFLCAPAEARRATVWAEMGDDSSEQASVALAAGEATGVELRVLLTAPRRGRVIGRVYDAMTDDPVATAAVSVSGHAHESASNRQGQFVLSDLRPGARELEVRRLGYATLRYPIEVMGDITTEVDIGLVPTPVEMEPIVATVARLRRLEIKGFYERKYWGELTGNGYFFSPEYIERWRPSDVRFLVVSNVPGITWKGENRRMGQGFGSLMCKMSIIVDGFAWGGWPGIPWSQIAGVEVYKGPATLPAEFGGSDARCGAVVVWTK